MKVAINQKELTRIAYDEIIDWQCDLDKISYDTYSPFFEEITEDMNFIQIQEVVNKKPEIAKIAREKHQYSLN